jgi:hypothetical protein
MTTPAAQLIAQEGANADGWLVSLRCVPTMNTLWVRVIGQMSDISECLQEPKLVKGVLVFDVYRPSVAKSDRFGQPLDKTFRIDGKFDRQLRVVIKDYFDAVLPVRH